MKKPTKTEIVGYEITPDFGLREIKRKPEMASRKPKRKRPETEGEKRIRILKEYGLYFGN